MTLRIKKDDKRLRLTEITNYKKSTGELLGTQNLLVPAFIAVRQSLTSAKFFGTTNSYNGMEILVDGNVDENLSVKMRKKFIAHSPTLFSHRKKTYLRVSSDTFRYGALDENWFDRVNRSGYTYGPSAAKEFIRAYLDLTIHAAAEVFKQANAANTITPFGLSHLEDYQRKNQQPLIYRVSDLEKITLG